ncbi:MAG: hypothetical protein O9320_09805 [Magnetospirillum sp.]|jgi:hypothetical protein|nr:hypothetical protein [Magnetospirillum sp.]
MLLGTILKRLGHAADAAQALDAMNDIVRLAEVEAMADRHAESPAEYVCGATRRFAADASSEDWLALMTAIERSDDPARATLDNMLRWSLARDATGPTATGCGCAASRPGDAAE